MDRIFGSGFGSQKSSKPLPLEAQLELVLIDNHLVDHLGKPNGDWVFEEDMVVPLHLLYPGGERERSWLEEVVVVTPEGGRPLFSWGFEPLTGS